MSDLVVWVLPDDIGHSEDLESMLRSYGGREITLRQKGWPDFPHPVYVVVDE